MQKAGRKECKQDLFVLPAYLSVWLSVCLPVCLSVCLMLPEMGQGETPQQSEKHHNNPPSGKTIRQTAKQSAKRHNNLTNIAKIQQTAQEADKQTAQQGVPHDHTMTR